MGIVWWQIFLLLSQSHHSSGRLHLKSKISATPLPIPPNRSQSLLVAGANWRLSTKRSDSVWKQLSQSAQQGNAEISAPRKNNNDKEALLPKKPYRTQSFRADLKFTPEVTETESSIWAVYVHKYLSIKPSCSSRRLCLDHYHSGPVGLLAHRLQND